ncbi:MAG: cytochrome C [Flavobacteriaceae bacterium]|nr:MAG: cytochrome C [Flavobacteriaceae bacterium]
MKRLFFIGLFTLLVLAVIFVWSKSYYSSQEEAFVVLKTPYENELLTEEVGVFKRAEFANDYKEMNANFKAGRTLKEYYKNRAFYGAPPYIPHPIAVDGIVGDKTCLKCHENGGYVSKYDAFAPVSPHPEKVNCRQCHVLQKTTGFFVEENTLSYVRPPIGNTAFTGAPPIIPHQIQLHENCLACHAGPAAPKEIRVNHPERSNCRQCHVLNNKSIPDMGDFLRKNDTNDTKK